MCDKGSVAKEKLGAEVKYGHCLEVICKDADVQLHWPSFDELYAQVSHGIILHDGCKASEYIDICIYIYIATYIHYTFCLCL